MGVRSDQPTSTVFFNNNKSHSLDGTQNGCWETSVIQAMLLQAFMFPMQKKSDDPDVNCSTYLPPWQ